MRFSTRSLLLISSNILLPLACLIFASAFFPYKPFIAGFASYPQTASALPIPPPQFDKVIFMVVDALRSDFVFSHNSGFEFTQRLIQHGSALPFTAHATAPTVTMPRVKAITTGSIPSFLDMILNFAESDTSSSLAKQDTWLAQIASKKTGKLLLFGDDTWLKLFPNTFDRADGTSSFFVSDFTEVDNNVTRHITGELQNIDWSAMIMHYLGMDHIGHKSGPRSVNMKPKQHEMDGIVRQIYSAMEKEKHLQSTLFVLCGDHGMNDAGNHGGSAPGETSPALVLISPKFQNISNGLECPTHPIRDFSFYETVEQSDIAPTLAGLLGFPVPLNNLGVFVKQVLDLWPDENDRVQLMLQNAQQMLRIVKATFPHPWYSDPNVPLRCSNPSSSSESIACAWKDVQVKLNVTGNMINPQAASIAPLTSFCRTAQQHLSSTASNYNVPNLYIGVALAFMATLLALSTCNDSFKLSPLSTTGFSAVILVAYFSTMFASSYVEEEQQFWYWIAPAWIFMQNAHSLQYRWRMVLALIVSLRIQQRWQQSGQKHAGASDIASILAGRLSPVLWLLMLATFLDLGGEISLRTLGRVGLGKMTSRVLAVALTAGAFVFKLCFTYMDEPELLQGMLSMGYLDMWSWCRDVDLVWLARPIFIGIGVIITFVISVQALSVDTLQPLLNLLLLMQTRVTNIPLFLLYNIQLRLLRRLQLTPAAITLTSLIFAHVSFFSMGNTNSISSLDLSNAYNGVASYNAVLVALLLYLGNWAGPIWWSFSGLLLLLEQFGKQKRARDEQDERLQYDGDTTAANNEVSDALMSRTLTVPSYANAGVVQGPLKVKPNAAATSNDTKGGASDQDDRHTHSQLSLYLSHLSILTLFIATATFGVMFACTMLRTHLFVWTVFSPKFLYAVAWLVLWHLMGNVILGGIMAWLG